MAVGKANIIIYDIVEGKVIFFLSKRSLTAKMFPDYFSFFGGKIEANESSKEALIREINEELGFKIKNFIFLGSFETPGATKFVFYKRIQKSRVDKLVVNEGQYGKWFTTEMIENESKMINSDKRIIHRFRTENFKF